MVLYSIGMFDDILSCMFSFLTTQTKKPTESVIAHFQSAQLFNSHYSISRSSSLISHIVSRC